MKIDDITIGQHVAGRDFPDQGGTVERIDHDEHIVYVRFTLDHGRTSLDDIDPSDLVPFCEDCSHYHDGACLCPECGQPVPCGKPGHS